MSSASRNATRRRTGSSWRNDSFRFGFAGFAPGGPAVAPGPSGEAGPSPSSPPGSGCGGTGSVCRIPGSAGVEVGTSVPDWVGGTDAIVLVLLRLGLRVGLRDPDRDRFPPLADARALSAALAQVVQLRPPHPAVRHDLDLGDRGRVDRERSLDADAEGDLADGEGLAKPPAPAADHDPLE